MSTITFNCTSCGQTMRVGADKAGRKAKCTKCATILTIPAAEEVLDEVEVVAGPPKRDAGRSRREEDEDNDRPRSRRDDDDEDRPRRRGRDDDYDDDDDFDRKKAKAKGKTDWGKVGVGGLIHMIGAIATMSGVILLFITTLLALIGSFAGSFGLIRVVGIVGLIAMSVYVLGYIPLVVGNVFFLWLSPKHGWGAALGSLIAGGIALLVVLTTFMMLFIDPMSGAFMMMIQPLVPSIHIAMAGMVFAAVGKSRDDSLAGRGKGMTIYGFVVTGYYTIFLLVLIIIRSVGAGMGGIYTVQAMQAVGMGMVLGMFVTFMIASMKFKNAASN